jgi:hypothetical protein
MLGDEAVKLPGYNKRKQVVRLWSEAVATRTKQDAIRRQEQEINRKQRETATLKPILKCAKLKSQCD